MSEALDYTARIKAKGLDSTGFTEEHAKVAARKLGSHHVMIVELVADEVVSKSDGTRQVKLAITQAEPVPAELEDRVREFMRALYRQRPDQMGQAVLSGVSDGLSAEDALGAMSAVIASDETEGSDDAGVWDGDTEPEPEPEPEPASEPTKLKAVGSKTRAKGA